MANQSPRISALMAVVLSVVASRPNGATVRELVAAVQQGGRRLPVARATVSRVLRRLGRLGAVELYTGLLLRKMSDMCQQATEKVSSAQANPEAAYREALSQRRKYRRDYDPWRSSAAFVAAMERDAKRIHRLHTRRVTITEVGRGLLDGTVKSSQPAGES